MSYRHETDDQPVSLLLKLIGGITLGVTGAILIVWAFIWMFRAIWGHGAVYWHDSISFFATTLFPGGLPTPAFWIIAAIIIGVSLVIWRFESFLVWTLAIVMILGSIALGISKGVTNDILAADFYEPATTLQVEDTSSLPATLSKYVRNGDLEVTLIEGDLKSAWVPRVASATGATRVLSKASSSVNSNELLSDTITYIYGEGDSGVWTAIRDGVGQQDIYGISSWNGTGEEDRINTCRFSGDFALNRNFGGDWGKNLWNDINAKYPNFFYSEGDMWGFCDGTEPVIVLPGVYLSHFDMRVIDEAAGVVTIRGSVTGKPVLNLLEDVKPGELPGPVYAQRLVDNQRNALDWAAGWWQSVNESFGFDSTNVAAQAGNNSNYLLKSKLDGRLYWVNPMKPQGSDDETLIAYSLIPADVVTKGVLNEQIVYVLNEDDPRVANLDDLASYAQDAVCNLPDANYCTDSPKGKIVEFLPVSDRAWQAFGENDGRVKYLIDLEVGSTITTRTTNLLGDEEPTAPATGNPTPNTGSASCDDPSSLTDQQLASCLASLADELQSRNTSE